MEDKYATTLFAEMVKNRNLKELTNKRKQEMDERVKERANQDDIQIIEGSDDKDNSNGSSSSTTVVDGATDKSYTAATTPATMDLTMDVLDIPVPSSSLPTPIPTIVKKLIFCSIS